MTTVRESAGAPATNADRPTSTRRYVAAALFVDFGNDRGENQRPPRARYECVRCTYRSEIVTGAAAVAAFTATAASAHRSVCPALQENHQ